MYKYRYRQLGDCLDPFEDESPANKGRCKGTKQKTDFDFRRTDDVVKADRQNRQAKKEEGSFGGRNFDAGTEVRGRAIRAHGHGWLLQLQMSVSLVHLISLLPYSTFLAQPLLCHQSTVAGLRWPVLIMNGACVRYNSSSLYINDLTTFLFFFSSQVSGLPTYIQSGCPIFPN